MNPKPKQKKQKNAPSFWDENTVTELISKEEAAQIENLIYALMAATSLEHFNQILHKHIELYEPLAFTLVALLRTVVAKRIGKNVLQRFIETESQTGGHHVTH